MAVRIDKKTCEGCILKGQFQDGSWGCQISKAPIDLEKDFCSKHRSSGFTCDNCHTVIAMPQYAFVVEFNENEWKTLCPNCVMMWLNEK